METNKRKLGANLTPLAVIAISLGTAIGWGSLVVTSSTYLAQSGVMGSVLGMIAGMLVMLIIARNYTYLMQEFPDAGGAYAYSRELFGNDYGFLTTWFLALTYLSVLWANATSVPLFVKYFVGEVLQFGRLYSIFGYDIYVGEILATAVSILIIALICLRSNNIPVKAMIALAAIFVFTIFTVALVSIARHSGGWTPYFVPESGSISQIIRIAVISPWAYIGFESISHGAEEFSFSKDKIFRIFVISVVIVTALYIAITVLSMTAYPERYATWLEYIRDRGNLEGLEALPAFYAAQHYMGSAGVSLLMAALLALVISSLFGNIFALSRLFYALGREELLPVRFSKLDEKGIPANAIVLITVVSVFIPLVGRTAIGWIVDVTTIGATLIYGIVSAAARKQAKLNKDRTELITGTAGLVIMVGYGLYTLIPNLFSVGSIEKETYFLFIVWSILGFFSFRMVLARDNERKYGESVIVWAAMLSLMLFISVLWMRQSMIESNDRMKENIQAHYVEMNDGMRNSDEMFIERQLDEMERDDQRAIIITMTMFTFSVIIMFSNHSYMSKRAIESDRRANIDSMTGVKSKLAYMNMVRDSDSRISKGTMGEFAVVVCDVNGLKQVNDTLGHEAGDKYIIDASKLVCTVFKHSPVFRVGGDEFVAVLSGMDYENRDELMQQLHDSSLESIKNGGAIVAGGCSNYIEGEDVDFHTVFIRADNLMYLEKRALKELKPDVRSIASRNLET